MARWTADVKLKDVNGMQTVRRVTVEADDLEAAKEAAFDEVEFTGEHVPMNAEVEDEQIHQEPQVADVRQICAAQYVRCRSRMTNRIYFGDNLAVLNGIADASIDLIYIDPPFNTGKPQGRTQMRTVQSPTGDRTGFHGRRYETVKGDTKAYADLFDDYLGFLEPRLREAYRVLAAHGSLYFHIDYREVHYCKVLLDGIFGRECFLNEVIWAYDYGGRTSKKWPPKHDNILVYVKDPEQYVFNVDEIERIPYMAPGLVGPEKAARGKLPTDTWWHTIVPTQGTEKTGYPTQKPLGVLKRIIQASSRPGDLVLDFFAGSGTTGAACLSLGRKFMLVDSNPQALHVMACRFAGVDAIEWVNWQPDCHAPVSAMSSR